MVWRNKNTNIENKTLILFVTKNEDTFVLCYLYVKFLFLHLAISHHRTQSDFYLSTEIYY